MTEKKIHRPVWEGAVGIIAQIVLQGLPLDQTLKLVYKKNPKWGSKDRRLIGQMVFDCVRYWRKYLVMSGYTWNDQTVWGQEHVTACMNIWAQEHDYADKVENTIALSFNDRESFPDWMAGETSEEVLAALNQEAHIFLRANALKNSASSLGRLLQDKGIQVEVMGDAVKVVDRAAFRKATNDNLFFAGLFEVQDLGSQQIAPMLQVKPHDRVLDACAGNGGKTLHLAQLMHNQGQIMASDISELKLRQIEVRCRDARISIVRTRLAPISGLLFDAVLLDVPCSGLGVIRRHPERKWQCTPDKIAELVEVQRGLLESYKKTVRPGGALLYATCTFVAAENQLQIKSFLARNYEWKLEEEKSFLAGARGWDCFYAARLRFGVSV
ncbi:MAG: RsmB/NOP family class I SAM-dependent RNA methyltransferase [Bdellovibrio sp.]|nr:RsmB/NOP family class I SAM-dependent RNA methyltransferase [Bdellovibrio sp.]